MAYLQNLRILVGKLEGTAGSMETLDDADFNVRIRDPQVTLTVEVDDEGSKFARGDHAEDSSLPGVQTGQISFNIQMTTGATVGAAPEWEKFANACGAYSAAYAAAGYYFAPRTEYDNKTMTIWIYDIERGATPTAVCYKFAGCMGNMVISSDGVGKPWMAAFTFNGKLKEVDYDVANAAIPVLLAPGTTCSQKLIMQDAMIGSTALKISSFSLDVGNDVQPMYNQKDSTGCDYYGIVNRKPRLSMNPLVDSGKDIYADLISGITGCPTTYRTFIGNTGAAKGLVITLPKSQILTAGVANREGLVNWDLNLKGLANGYTGSVADGGLEEQDTWEIRQGQRS